MKQFCILFVFCSLGVQTFASSMTLFGTWKLKSAECSSKAAFKIHPTRDLFHLKFIEKDKNIFIFDQLIVAGDSWQAQQGRFSVTPGGFCAEIKNSLRSGVGTSSGSTQKCFRSRFTNENLVQISYGPLSAEQGECPPGDRVHAEFIRVSL